MRRMMVLATFLVLTGTPAIAASTLDDGFLRYEARGSAYELAFARLGVGRATRTDVRAYAETLVKDHSAYSEALRALAHTKGIGVPSGLERKAQRRLDLLSATQGSAFDTSFVREATRCNNDDVRAFRKAASRTADPDIGAFVRRFLPIDEKHEADARALTNKNLTPHGVIYPPGTGDSMSVAAPPIRSAMPVIRPPAASN